MMGR
jgi:hypothetical protein